MVAEIGHGVMLVERLSQIATSPSSEFHRSVLQPGDPILKSRYSACDLALLTPTKAWRSTEQQRLLAGSG